MTSENAPFVSVIIPHLDQCDLLVKCLDSLDRQTFDRARFEVIVVDNGTPGGVGLIAEQFPRVLFAHAAEKGAAHARNEAMTHARGEILAFIDADCMAEADWIETGVEALKSADLAGGRIVVTSENESAPSPVEAFERVFAFQQRNYVEKKSFSATANLFVWRRAAEAIGLFTNGLSEDVDWCRRGVALGFHLAFNPNSVVRHPARRDWSELIRKWERLIAERWEEVDRKDAFGVLRWLSLAAATALSFAPHLLKVMTSAELKSAHDRIAAACVLAKIRLWRAWRMTAMLAAK